MKLIDTRREEVSSTIFHRCIDVTSRNAIRKIIEDRLNRFELQPSNDSLEHCVLLSRVRYEIVMERNATPHSMPLDENPSRDIINYRRVV